MKNLIVSLFLGFVSLTSHAQVTELDLAHIKASEAVFDYAFGNNNEAYEAFNECYGSELLKNGSVFPELQCAIDLEKNVPNSAAASEAASKAILGYATARGGEAFKSFKNCYDQITPGDVRSTHLTLVCALEMDKNFPR